MGVPAKNPATVTEVDLRIRDNVQALLRVRKTNQAALARHMGSDYGTMTERMKGRRRFWASQLVCVAEFFDVDVGVLYAESEDELAAGLSMTLEELLAHLKTPCFNQQPQLWPVAVKDAS